MRTALPSPLRQCSARLLAPALALVVAILVATVAAGCSGDSDTPGDASDGLSEPTAAPTLEVEPVTELGKVTGALPRRDRHRTREQVSRVAVRWLTAAYVGGSYPRAGFDDAFPGFTAGAREAAHRDLGVLTNAPIGRRVDDVTPSRLRVEVDVLAVERRPVGATAHLLTSYETAGDVTEHARVTGRLMLTRRDGRWKVFAYHVNKGEHR